MDGKITRRQFLNATAISATAMAIGAGLFAGEPKRANVLLITADDANWDSFGCTGCKIPGISPNVDNLASEGMRFEHAHVTSAICQPSRSVIGTGRYPHRNGALGFDPIKPDVPTIVECLKSAGYHTGILAKVEHMTPHAKFPWDYVVQGADLGNGRNPQLYYNHTKAFLEQAKSSRKPFFLMANSQDPHRPFPTSEQAGEKSHAHNVSRIYKPEEVEVPGFLPQGIPDIKKEIAQYYTAVHRCDETVGQVLRALRETGFEDSTIVIFLSDNGISVPFAKTNCYEASTRTPLIIKWPGKVKPGSVDREHFVSGIDLMPTLIEALELPAVEGMDGRSFLDVLKGKKLPGRDKVFTFITSTSARKFYPMRSVRTATRSYIFNAWSDGKTEFRNEAMSGLTWNAMVEAGKSDPKIAARCNFYLYRVREEFYNLVDDPYELNNLISSQEYRKEIDQLRADLLEMMKETGDPLLDEFRRQIGA